MEQLRVHLMQMILQLEQEYGTLTYWKLLRLIYRELVRLIFWEQVRVLRVLLL